MPGEVNIRRIRKHLGVPLSMMIVFHCESEQDLKVVTSFVVTINTASKSLEVRTLVPLGCTM